MNRDLPRRLAGRTGGDEQSLHYDESGSAPADVDRRKLARHTSGHDKSTGSGNILSADRVALPDRSYSLFLHPDTVSDTLESITFPAGSSKSRKYLSLGMAGITVSCLKGTVAYGTGTRC